jgi:hypothetical protein
MATRMQQRRGTAAQWISTNSGNGPILNAGEIGYETDTNKFKIGDGTNHWVNLDYFVDANSTVNPSFGSSITFEGATDNAFETTLSITDPTADRTITFPDATGTVALTSDISELSQDAIDAALTAGTGITKTYNDAANTLTLAVDTTTIQARVANVSDIEIGYLDGVTSAIQTQLDSKLASSTAGTTYAPLANPALTGTATAVNLTISGDLTVNGTTTNINSTNLVVEDKNIVLGDVASPTNTTADGGGITLNGLTNKTFNWVNANTAWTSSENLDLATGKTFKIAGTDVLSGSTLGAGVTASSLTSVGTIATGTWSATTIALNKGGTGATTQAGAANAVLPSQASANGKYLTSDGTNVSWGTVSGYSAPTLGSTSIASGATVSNLNGITINSTTIPTSKTLVATDSTAYVVPSQTGNSGKYLTTDGTTSSWGTVSSYSAPTIGSTSIASGATVTTIAGLTKINTTATVFTDASGYEVDRDIMLIMGAL